MTDHDHPDDRTALKRLCLAGLALMACLALASAACGGDDFEAGPLGAVEVGPGGLIQIRSLSVLSGDNTGVDYRSVALAVRDYGPIKGHAVAHVGMHDLCPTGGGAAIGKVIAADPQVVGVVGTDCSLMAVEFSPVLSAAGKVMISGTNTSPVLTSDLQGHPGSDHHPGYYRTAHNDLIQGRVVADFVFHELGLRTMAAIHDGDPYTSGLATSFAEAFQNLGGEVVAFTSVSKGDTDMTAVLAEVAASSPEGIFFPLFVDEGAAIARQIGETADLAEVTLISADALLSADFLGSAESEGIYFSGPNLDFGGNTNEATNKTPADLLAAYQSEHGGPPAEPFWGHVYDATTILLAAIEQVAVEDGETLYIDRAALRQALNGTSGFAGITGSLTCDPFGDCAGGGISIRHHTDASVTDINELPVVYRGQP